VIRDVDRSPRLFSCSLPSRTPPLLFGLFDKGIGPGGLTLPATRGNLSDFSMSRIPPINLSRLS